MQYKGALTEQFVLQELQLLDDKQIYYWSPENSVAEVDFLIQAMGMVIPIEVKAERNLRAKSLSVFIQKYNTQRVLRLSMSKYEQGAKITDLPLYAISLIPKILTTM